MQLYYANWELYFSDKLGDNYKFSQIIFHLKGTF